MKRSKLEPGCKAIVIGGRVKENYGKLVTVGNFIGGTTEGKWRILDIDLWEIDQPLLFTNGEMYRFCGASKLQRIDDDDENTTEPTTEEIEETA